MNKLAARGKNAHKMDDENAPQQMSAAQRAAQRASEEDDGILINIVNWLLAREKKPPLPWATNRQKEIDDYLITRSFGVSPKHPKRVCIHGPKCVEQAVVQLCMCCHRREGTHTRGQYTVYRS